MKKLVMVLAILVLVSGCVETVKEAAEGAVDAVGEVADKAIDIGEEAVDGVVGIGEEAVEGVEEAVEEVKPAEEEPVAEELGDNKYKMKSDTSYTIEGVEFVITDIDVSSSQFRVDVAGSQIVFVGTKEVEIASGLEMFVDTFKNYGLSDPRTYVIMGIKKFVLGEDEYLVYRGSPIKLDDVNKTSVSVSDTKVDTAGVRTVSINVGSDSESIVEGRTARFDKFFVTNVRTFTKDPGKKYAILKIVPR